MKRQGTSIFTGIVSGRLLTLSIIFVTFLFVNTNARAGAKYEPPDGRIIHGLGQYVSYLYSDAENWQLVDEYQNSVGKIPTIYSAYAYLDPFLDGIDSTNFSDIISNHTYPYVLLIGLSLFDYSILVTGTANIPVQTILNGGWDARIIDVANQIKALNSPVLLRPGYEFGSGNSGIHNDPDVGPTEFKNIWMYIYNIFQQENVTNVAWVWNTVNPQSFNFDPWYPGDNYVDWWGINYFSVNQLNNGDNFLDNAAAHNKPVIICESNPIQNGGTTNSSNWNNWFIPYFQKIRNYSQIKAFIYVSDPWDRGLFSSWPDSRITSNALIQANYAQELTDSIYIHMDEYLANPGIIIGATQSPGDLIITEFMSNPAAVGDANGEYVEFYNTTGSAIDIDGFILKDDDNDSIVVNNGAPLMVPAMGFLVMGNDGDSLTNGGYRSDYAYSSFFLANGADEIILQTPGGVEICRLNYTVGDPFGAGVSLELSNVSLQVNGVTQESDYVAATDTLPGGDFGSPGTAGNTQGTGGGNSPPAIGNIMRMPFIPDANQNTAITADVSDPSGSVRSTRSITLVELRYSINDGAMQSVSMSHTGGDTYSGDILASAYSDGDRVEYWIYAEDDLLQSGESAHFDYFAGDTPISDIHPVDISGVLLYAGYDARVTGVATAETGIYSTSNIDAYIQDAGGGINVFQFGLTVSMMRGNSYTVTGTVDQFNGKAEIVPPDPGTDIIDNGAAALPDAVEKTIAELLQGAETYEGMLIKILQADTTGLGDGWPASGNNANIEITDDGGSSVLTLRIDTDTNIDGSAEPNWPVDLQGIFIQFDSSVPYDSGYQITPRDTADIGAPCTPGFLGDINGDGIVNSTDGLIGLSFDAGLPIPQPVLDRINLGFSDANDDGVTNSTDGLLLLSFDVGIPVPYPIADPVCL